jgi:tetratricopeptide (TPR) repeat protein
MPYDLFISYSRRDNEQGRITQFVERIKTDFAAFAKRELVPFFYQQEIYGMQDWRQRILQGLRESRLLLACLSPAYLQSECCEWEFVEYLKYEIGHLHGFNGIAPIYFVEVPGWDDKNFDQRCAAWIAELRKRQHFDLRPWHDQGEEILREAAVQERMGKLNRQIVQTITRGERAEKSLGNVDAHNPHFFGRTANLRMLRENFVKPGHIGVVTAINGVGGLGKTALAIEYAHAFADEYGGGRWQVSCVGKDDLRIALAELATPIGFEFTDDEKKNADRQFERAHRELKKLADAREPHRCLLILDNVDKPGLLDPAQVARLNGGDWLHVLATTRLGENELHGAHRDRSFLAIDELPPDDALALIESYQLDGRFRSEAERDAAREIVRLLNCFTLAVESAAVYLGQFANDVTCAAFFARLKKEGLEGLDTAASQSSEGVLHGEKRLTATLQPTLERLGAAETLALEFAALLPPDQVPLPWLRALVAKTFPDMERDAEPGYPDPWKNVLRRLFSLRLLQATDVVDADGQPRVARVHRLVQEVLTCKPGEELSQRNDAMVSLAFERSEDLERHWHELDYRWEIPPMIALANQLLDRVNSDAPRLVIRLGQWLSQFDSSTNMQTLIRRALKQQETDSTTDPKDVAINLSNWGAILERDSNYAEAEPLLRKALAIDEKHREPTHPFIAIRLNNLGLLLNSKGSAAEAESLFRRALQINELNYGLDDPLIAANLNNLGQALRDLGRLPEAEQAYRKSIALLEKHFGQSHPRLGVPLHNLARLLGSMKSWEEAKSLYYRSLASFETCLGEHHPFVASPLRGLASLLRTTGHGREAEPLMRRALTIRERALGPDHPGTLGILNDLAGLLEEIGCLEESLKLRKRVSETQERTLGSEHPDTLLSLSMQSYSLRKRDHAGLAEPIDRRVGATTAKVLGDIHPLTIHRRNNLALKLIMLGKLEEARQILTANWRLNTRPHANTTPRIAFLRHLIALLLSQTDTPFLGQLKTLLTGSELPVASDAAVPYDFAYFIEFLKPKLGEHNAEFLTALVAAVNDPTKLSALDAFPEWREQPLVPLDTPWL